MSRPSRARRLIQSIIRYAVFIVCVGPLVAGRVNLLPSQPPGTRINAIRTDSAGNIYIAGSAVPPGASEGNLRDAFVAKFSPGGVEIHRTVLAGAAADVAMTIVLETDGTVYVGGYTFSRDFPVTSNAVQPVLGPATGGQAFLAKLSPQGRVESATYFGGGAQTLGMALALDREGGVYLTGTSRGDGFPAASRTGNGFFLAKFDSALSELLWATQACGGSALTLDAQGNIYLAGAASGPIGSDVPLPATPGAFQGRIQAGVCRGSGIVFLPCDYQFVQKLDPTGTNLSYATFVSGSWGAVPAGIAVDAAGNAIVAGMTNSPDYPVTELAFQSVYLANAAPPPNLLPGRPSINPPPSTGYITKVNANGTGLVWSTFFGGSVRDEISGLVLDPGGYVYVTGRAHSHDLPGLSGSPPGCDPTVNQGLGFVARVSPHGMSLSPTQLIYGAPACTYASCSSSGNTPSNSWALAVNSDGSAIAAGANGAVAQVELFGSARVACVADPADNVQLTSVAPGQVLSIFGSRLAPSRGVASPGGSSTVTFNGFAAPVLYAMGSQVNIQVPYEIAGQDAAEMRVHLPDGALEHTTFPVVPRQPRVFLSPDALLARASGYFECENTFSRAPPAFVLNADGTVNSCENGARAGSTVTIFMNGLGPTQPPQETGAISASPAVAISPEATGAGILATTTSPGAISGVAEVQFETASAGIVEVVPVVDGIPARHPVVVWVTPGDR